MGRMTSMAFLTGLIFVALACGSDGGVRTGSIRVHWVVGGTTCETIGVKDVDIHILDDGFDILEGARTYACNLGGDGVLIVDIPEGVYSVEIEGIDSDGNAYYEGSFAGEASVSEGLETDLQPAINLQLKNALILLNWEFRNGKLCTTNGVSHVEVNAFDTTLNPVYMKTFECDPFDDPVLTADKGILIEDLRGNDDLTFDLFGVDETQARLFRGTSVIHTTPGGLDGTTPQDLLVALEQCVVPADCL